MDIDVCYVAITVMNEASQRFAAALAGYDDETGMWRDPQAESALNQAVADWHLAHEAYCILGGQTTANTPTGWLYEVGPPVDLEQSPQKIEAAPAVLVEQSRRQAAQIQSLTREVLLDHLRQIVGSPKSG